MHYLKHLFLALGVFAVSATCFAQERDFIDDTIALVKKYGVDLERGSAYCTVKFHGNEIYICNALKKIGDGKFSEEESIKKLISFLNNAEQARSEDHQYTWKEAAALVRPAATPKEYDVPENQLVCESFDVKTSLCFVIDSPLAKKWVTKQNLAQWKISTQELKNKAIKNLDSATPFSSFVESKDPDGNVWLVIINTQDSYDAARIFSDYVRTTIAKSLGNNYFIAIPNRDFLVAWRVNLPAHAQLIAKIENDFVTRPYPITSSVFIVDGGKITVANQRQRESGRF